MRIGKCLLILIICVGVEAAYFMNPPLSDHRRAIEKDYAIALGVNPNSILVDGIGHVITRKVEYKNYIIFSRASFKGIPLSWGFFGTVITNTEITKTLLE